MTRIKDKLFSFYKESALTVPFMAFALFIRVIGFILAAFLFLCICIGIAIPCAILFGIGKPIVALQEKMKWTDFLQKLTAVMEHEFCDRIWAVLEFWTNL